ncbi:MAG: transglutaminase domain-containing protein [Candidatus Gracilibacteria bacterium]|nr:transglutaminase domain-containing protein [Candidatus Gracilibacteria bacterium]
MKLLKIGIFIITFFFSFQTHGEFQAYGNHQVLDESTKQSYNKFYSIVKSKYKYDNGLSYLYLLDKALNSLHNSSKLTEKNRVIIYDLQKLNNEKIFNLELDNKEKINEIILKNIPILNNFSRFYYNSDAIIMENGIRYTYNFSKKYFFEKLSEVDVSTLSYNGLYGKDILVYYENGNVNFVKDFEKVKLISDDIIYGFPNKYELLKTIRNNKLFDAKNDDDANLLNLEKISLELTKGLKSDDAKIKIIYDYILKNVSYSINFSMDDYEIFSGIDTFKNKNGVCEGYVELFNLMLGFNGIQSKILIGDVIDAVDFPLIGHAWVQIGDNYYDITFDDPVGATETKTFSQYSYYKLPKDLFYTNRFDKGQTPESLKNTTIDYRKAIIKVNLSKLVNKYKDSDYNLLKLFKFKEKYNIASTRNINTEDLINILGVTNMENFGVYIDGRLKYVKNLNYIELEDNIIDTFLEQNNYNLSGYTILRRIKDDGSTSLIISKDITYNN